MHTGQVLKVKNTFIDFDADRTPLATRLRPICSAAGRLDALGGPDEDDMLDASRQFQDISLGSAISKVESSPAESKGSEPASGGLRGFPTFGAGLGSYGGGVYVKNTFLDFV
eukprot:CAMPEP_0197684472 /NCGR_PEP_ID=MMETSP1338-20131121/99540_1 /TAXON_ID=43686 ORGANISM="Pelagodinium beii, Strain RCC1491" /NCGR_SAMPLE_ID=MMETSP1338 /ASSEMBLY_ACC=CAM_ASM_000754 /LENGTH=111 /DNA_ID=CAMNT_0043266189 /DNA_START=39 /DNA_END=370 /DNA_ORIENTATION=+